MSEYHDAEHWRERAQEARAEADEMHDPIAKETMLWIARAYEDLARRVEEGTDPFKSSDTEGSVS